MVDALDDSPATRFCVGFVVSMLVILGGEVVSRETGSHPGGDSPSEVCPTPGRLAEGGEAASIQRGIRNHRLAGCMKEYSPVQGPSRGSERCSPKASNDSARPRILQEAIIQRCADPVNHSTVSDRIKSDTDLVLRMTGFNEWFVTRYHELPRCRLVFKPR
jgi:hypothetical protein